MFQKRPAFLSSMRHTVTILLLLYADDEQFWSDPDGNLLDFIYISRVRKKMKNSIIFLSKLLMLEKSKYRNRKLFHFARIPSNWFLEESRMTQTHHTVNQNKVGLSKQRIISSEIPSKSLHYQYVPICHNRYLNTNIINV